MPQKSQEFKRVGECLYRNQNKTYFALIKVGGKQIKRSLWTEDLALAKRRLADLRTKTQRLCGRAVRNIRFDEFADNWLESIKPDLKPKSWDRRRVALVGLRPFFNGSLMKSVGHAQIEQWRRERGAMLSARSHNIELETLKILLRRATEHGILLDNPADKLKRRKQSKKLPEIPSRQDFLKLAAGLRAAPKAISSGAADMVEFLAYSGMRVGEAREVRIEDIDFTNNRLLITGGRGGTKNLEQRSIPLFPNLRQLLIRMSDGKIRPASNIKLFTLQSPRGAIRNACERMGLKHYAVHSLRHFFASNAVEENIHFKVIANWLGHKDGGVLVAKTYSHLREQFGAEMARRMTFTSSAVDS